VPRKEAPTTWHHHQPQPGSKSSSFKRQCGKFRGTDSPGEDDLVSNGAKDFGAWLAGEVFFGEGKARKDFLFHHKIMKLRGILHFCLVVSTNPSENYDRQIGVHLPQV